VHARRENFGFNKVRALYSDLWTGLGVKLYGLDGNYTGKANIAAYCRDVADVIIALPESNKFLRTMRPWVGWKVDIFSYASAYNPREQKTAEQKAEEALAEKGLKSKKSKKRDRFREHTSSIDYLWGLMAGTLLFLLSAIVFSFPDIKVTVPTWAILILWCGTVMLLFLTFIMYLRAVLIKRIGKIYRAKGETIYEVASVIN
jgi:hypothetical protein